MSAIATVEKKSATVATLPHPSAQVVLPKINKMGKAVMTAIDASFIKGCEASTVTYQGKKYPATKIYTVAGTFFKVLAHPMHVIAAKHHAGTHGELCTVEPIKAIAGYSKVKALPAPKK